MHQQVLDVRPAQVGRPRAPSHGGERSFVPAQFEMIAFFAIEFNAIRKVLTAWGGPGSQLEATSCPKKHVEMPGRLTQAEEGYSLFSATNGRRQPGLQPWKCIRDRLYALKTGSLSIDRDQSLPKINHRFTVETLSATLMMCPIHRTLRGPLFSPPPKLSGSLAHGNG